MEYSRQEYWSGLPFPSLGDLPNPGSKPVSPALASEFFTRGPLLFLIILLIFFYFFVLGLHCCNWAFSSCNKQGCSWLWNTASHCSGFSCCRAQALGHVGSVVVAHRPQITGSVTVAHGPSCPEACGILPQQGLNMCFLHC